MAETPTDYRRPYRPRPLALFNAVARHTAASGPMRRLDADAMVDSAKARTGLRDFGDESFLVALAKLVESINDEAELTPTGILLQRQRIVAALGNRLRVSRLLDCVPAIRELEIGKVVLITGLQRTGTTMLHRLVAAHPDMRALMSWEALNPAPLPGEGRSGFGRRLRHARTAERAIGFLAPAFFAVHPVEHDAPEEDVFLLDASFMSQMAEATMRVPTYAAWLERQDCTAAYQYLRTLLQVLQWQRPRPYWVLKTPQHLAHLDVVLETFPDVTVVQTHRDPRVAVTSFCSMVAHGRGVLSDRVDPTEVAEHWIAKIGRMIERSLVARDGTGRGCFVDVLYGDLVRDPMAQLERIYAAADVPFTEAAVQAAQRTAEQNVQNRYGKHVYDPGDFGLDCAAVARQFGGYRARFGIPRERQP